MQGDEFVAQLSGWEGSDPVLCRRILGYIGCMLDMAGVVEQQEHTHANGKENASCTFRFRWKLAQDVPINGRISSPERLSALADELAMFPDVASLADAIVELIHFQLSFPYVELWVRPVDSDGLTLVKGAGTKGTGIPICSLIQRTGSTIGRIDVEASPDSRQDLFNELVPMLALPLDATRLAGLQQCPAKNFARRLMDARIKWNLTPREVDVLEMLLRGDNYDEIVEELSYARSTVEQDANRIFRKSGARNRNRLSWIFWKKL
jgi:DNA-binding CsgD family transcriptional regulator